MKFDVTVKLQSMASLTGYAKILVEKKDYVQAALITCKVHDMLALSEDELTWLEEKDEGFRDKVAFFKKKNKQIPAIEKIRYMLENYYFNNDSEQKQNVAFALQEYERHYERSQKSIVQLRNDLIHNHVDFNANSFIHCTTSLVNRLYTIPFIQSILLDHFGNKQLVCNYEVERELKTQFGSIGKTGTPSTTPEHIISKNYFENLIDAKQNIFLTLKSLLRSKLESPYLDTTNIEISTVDSTSAYVWLTLPVLTKHPLPPEYTNRRKLYVPTLSILMTPLDFFVYLEFAGFTYYFRVMYYKYLTRQNNLKELLLRMVHDNDDKVYGYPCFRNVHWYVFQNHATLIKNRLAEEGEIAFQASFHKELEQWLHERQDSFCDSVEYSNPISWNVALAGWVYPANSFQNNTLSIQTFFEAIQSNIQQLKPLLKYFSKTKIPFNKDSHKICKQYLKLCETK